MTEQTQPTDAEILDTADEFRSQYKHGGTTFDEFDALGFARAVLAKWGTPAGAGEPFGYFHQLLNHEGKGNGVWLGAAERKVVEQAHVPGETSEEIVTLYTTPQPTQAQAGAVPLTAKQMESGREAIFSTGNPYCPCDSKTFRKVAEWVERHHGIKGADHG